ncbi:tetratricopeptide repeat protein [Nocardia cyriacigeorgica]|uniref:tetratricopeptide repeat protein n=1 Tax=Nocardia cyriacigeorgica TaxID=135487 RepID=UPI00189609FE|nr:tetratricopeptide repeat protein [Nocardia cyriacigeorgica]MBF6102306.1 tetratricopeptide repeat protein [Nocardia cyriacigeorgica]
MVLLVPAEALLDAALPRSAEVAMLLGNVLRATAVEYHRPALLARATRYGKSATTRAPRLPSAWSNLGATHSARFGASGDLADLDAAIGATRRAWDSAPLADHYRAHFASDAAAMLLERYRILGTTEDLTQANDMARLAVEVAAPDEANLRTFQANLSLTLRLLGEVSADAELLLAAIAHGTAACEPIGDATPTHLMLAHNALLAHHELTGCAADLDSAVELAERALAIQGGEPEIVTAAAARVSAAYRARYENSWRDSDLDRAITVALSVPDERATVDIHNNLAIGYVLRFERDRSRADLAAALAAARRLVPEPADAEVEHLVTLANILDTVHDVDGEASASDEAVRLLEGAIARCPADLVPTVLSNLGAFHISRFDRRQNAADLDRALVVLRQALRDTPASSVVRATYLTNIANAHHALFEFAGRAADLDACIAAQLEAEQLLPADAGIRVELLANICLARRTRFDAFGARADIDGAVAAGETALTSVGSRRQIGHLRSLLAGALRSRFAAYGDMADLEYARTASASAVEDGDVSAGARAVRLTVHASCLLTVYETVGDADALDRAIGTGRAALEHAERSTVGTAATNLANALLTRHELRGSDDDLGDAVDFARRSVESTPVQSPFRPGRLSNFGNVLRAHAVTTGEAASLDRAIDVGLRSVDTTDLRDPEIGAYWSNLGLSYTERFHGGESRADIDAGIDALQRAVAETPEGHPALAMYRGNVAMALRQRFDRDGEMIDIDRAIDLLEPAVAAIDPQHPQAGALLLALGNAWHSRCAVEPDAAAYNAACAAWRRAVESSSAPAAIRLTAAESLAVASTDREDWDEARFAYRKAVELVPVVAWHGLDRPGRERALAELAPMSHAACAIALNTGHRDDAVEILEAARSVLWKQTLDHRRDFAELAAHDPILAKRLAEVSRLLR